MMEAPAVEPVEAAGTVRLQNNLTGSKREAGWVQRGTSTAQGWRVAMGKVGLRRGRAIPGISHQRAMEKL